MAVRDTADRVVTLLRPVADTIDYCVHYEDGSSLTMPFSRQLDVGDTWRDTVAEWRVVRISAAESGEPVDIWVEPVRE
jgi:hypothetical protein